MSEVLSLLFAFGNGGRTLGVAMSMCRPRMCTEMGVREMMGGWCAWESLNQKVFMTYPTKYISRAEL